MTHEQYESKSQMKRVEILKAGEKQMSHDELLAKINDIRTNYLPETTSELAWERLADATRALRAVVELHKPPVIQNGKKIWINNDCVACSHNNPCPTLNAIEKELK